MVSWAEEALRGAKPTVFWSDRPDAPIANQALRGSVPADLAIIGGGFTGLWAALLHLEQHPDDRVVVLEADSCGFGASSRNGGFCDSSLTHGLHNGLQHWPDDTEDLIRLGRENLVEIDAAVQRHGIEADFRQTSEIDVAREQWQLDDLESGVSEYEAVGDNVEMLTEAQVRSHLDSPRFIGGFIRHNEIALLDPARMVWGLLRVVQDLGAEVFEHTRARSLSESASGGVTVTTEAGSVEARRVVVATNAFAEPIRSMRLRVIPIWDHVLMTEPLTSDQMASIGWKNREGVGDAANQFHYYRLSEDDRILWGGYDANYHFGGKVDFAHEQNEATHSLLAQHFFETFPQLEGLRFTHRWGGPIGTTSKFAAAFGTSVGGRAAWVAGYTGLGVGASRFGAETALDLAFGRDTERTRLEMVRKKPFPFPPEPLRYPIIQFTRRAIHRCDANEGKRGLWLRTLDAFGIGFDS